MPRGAKKGEHRKRTLVESDAIREVARRRSVGQPLIIVTEEGVRFEGVRTVNQGSFKRIGIEERYQRVKLTAFVNELIHVLKAGGKVLDPVSVAVRPDDTWWLVDGQQRFYAHLECDLPMLAAFYRVADFEAERTLFIALNRKVSVNAATMVKAWAGPSAAAVREAHDKPGGPLEGRVNFGRHAGRTFDASIVIKGMLGASAGLFGNGAIERLLTRTDAAMQTNQAAAERAEAFLRLIAQVFPGPRARVLPIIALGMVAYRRWTAGGHPTMPDGMALRRLRQTNWDAIAQVHARRFFPVFEQWIEARWRKED